MDWLERALRDTSDQCCRQFAEFIRRCSSDEREIKRWESDYGEIRVYMEKQPVDEIDIMEFDADFHTCNIPDHRVAFLPEYPKMPMSTT
ncbi:hypothetical protein NGC52_25720 [Klebsiella michiganensis]|jgi:hypothetical protein|uniref:Uncharacterized protein n=1 Tax=Klebsiella michiganensis TaxID=1134687 RepID=A0AAX3CNK3_9ENTR|nr:hypothetical protein [Klebsiella michiganensis]MDU7188193.1 hypothetical protein [Klebsiella sp.]QLW91299.1 hypothetical protein HV175_23260 [Klebsiella oxytoca]ELO7621660.1 hypothetical protein [Klebsiella michiganensis]ELT9702671.1 hypothetical protein [Klebsiella michiganensis]ELT9751042.1 hypothetical protein [Klebsiella michiganensis]